MRRKWVCRESDKGKNDTYRWIDADRKTVHKRREYDVNTFNLVDRTCVRLYSEDLDFIACFPALETYAFEGTLNPSISFDH